MKTIVIGGAGFLESYLCSFFLKKDHEIICIDNLVIMDKSVKIKPKL